MVLKIFCFVVVVVVVVVAVTPAGFALGDACQSLKTAKPSLVIVVVVVLVGWVARFPRTRQIIKQDEGVTLHNVGCINGQGQWIVMNHPIGSLFVRRTNLVYPVTHGTKEFQTKAFFP